VSQQKTFRLHEIHGEPIYRISLILGFISGVLAGVSEAIKSMPTEPFWGLINLVSIPIISAGAMWLSSRVTVYLVNGVLRRMPDLATFSVEEDL